MMDGRPVVALNLDQLNGSNRRRMGTAGVLSIVLLCVAIVVVLVYLLQLALGRKSTPVVDVVVGGATTEQEMSRIPPAEIAVGAVTTAAPVMTGAINVGAPASTGSEAFYGNLVPENLRMEPPANGINLGSVMPTGWRGQGAPTPSAIDHYFEPLERGLPAADVDDNSESMWANLKISREAAKRAIENSPAVDRLITMRDSLSKIGIDETFGLRPVPKMPLFTTTSHVFNDSSHRQEVIKTAYAGVYPDESRTIS
jgi:hypothetical protein